MMTSLGFDAVESTAAAGSSLSSTKRSELGRREGRKAKRALRRRIKPTHQRFVERMSGPGPIFDQHREVPRLPRGGDGLAAVSLRPSLCQRPPRVIQATIAVPLQRPATASRHRQLCYTSSTDHRSRDRRSLSAPPSVGGSRDATLTVNPDTDQVDDSARKDDEECRHPLPEAFQRKQHPDDSGDTRTLEMIPSRPTAFRGSGHANDHAGHRMIYTASPLLDHPCAVDASIDRDNRAEAEAGMSDLGAPTSGKEDDSDREEYRSPRRSSVAAKNMWEESRASEDERGSTIVLSSTVLLSPRGRSRAVGTSKYLASADNVKGELLVANKDEDELLPSRPGAATSDVLKTWQARMVLVNTLWGPRCQVGIEGDLEGLDDLVHSPFGTDEFAGDREIDFFIGLASTAATEGGAVPSAAADGFPERHATGEGKNILALEDIALRAVPLHALEPSRRYNPYHLRIVNRERGKIPHFTHTAGDMPSSTTRLADTRESTAPGAGVVQKLGDRLGEGKALEEKRAPGFEIEGPLAKADRTAGAPREAVTFCEKGVTCTNIHGETSCQPLEEWRREKERFNAIWHMDFCRGYPMWKYFRTIKRYVRCRRLDELRRRVEQGLVVLDPVCRRLSHVIVRSYMSSAGDAGHGASRPAVMQVAAELHRLRSLPLVTAQKGSGAEYTLVEFFEEQSRNALECEQRLQHVYDRCGVILGRMAKRHLAAEGLLVVNGAWNQAPMKKPSESEGHDGSHVVGDQSIEEVLLSISAPIGAGAPNNGVRGSSGIEDDSGVPTSWSFAARQRVECARMARAFRWARQQMRQELRGLAMRHVEHLLAAVRRRTTATPMRFYPGGSMPDRTHMRVGSTGGSSCEGKFCSKRASELEQNTRETHEDDVSRWRYEARPQPAGISRWALAIDEIELGDVRSLALEASTKEGSAICDEDVKEWREAFRTRINVSGGRRNMIELSGVSRSRSRISLPDNCLSVARAIQLACELVPHAVETLAETNPLGAKPLLMDIFESELTPNLRGECFFPPSHRFHGEQGGMTEDAFISATLKLSAVCAGGIDAQLSEVSSDYPSSEEEEGGKRTVPSIRDGRDTPRSESTRPTSTDLCNDAVCTDDRHASVIDVRAWCTPDDEHAAYGNPDDYVEVQENSAGDENASLTADAPRDSVNGVGQPVFAWNGRRKCHGAASGPFADVTLEVKLQGDFSQWDIEVAPPVSEFIDQTRSAQRRLLALLAGIPCLLEHPAVKPYMRMVEERGLGLDLPGGDPSDDADACEAELGLPEDDSKIACPRRRDQHSLGILSEKLQEEILLECDWLDNLFQDPYYRGVEDHVLRSLASSHNAVYRMVDGFRPLIDEFEELRGFAAEKSAREKRQHERVEPEVAAERLVASRCDKSGWRDGLMLNSVFLAAVDHAWLRDWYSRLERYRRSVCAKTTQSPQVLFRVIADSLTSHLIALPEACIRHLRRLGPTLMIDTATRLGAVLRRCNAVLCGALGGVDAMGEKTAFLGDIVDRIGRLGEEVNNVDKFGKFLKTIGCFEPRSFTDLESSPPEDAGLPRELNDTHSVRLPDAKGPAVRSGASTDFLGLRDKADSGPWGTKRLVAIVGESVPHVGDSIVVYDPRAAESQAVEAVSSLRFHLAALHRAVDRAQINIRVASQDFAQLLTKELAALGRDIARLEADITALALNDASTDPKKACRRLIAYGTRLIEIQDKEKRYRRYNELLDGDLSDGHAKTTARRQQDLEKLRLDRERVFIQRRKAVLKWEAQCYAADLRQHWEKSSLISCDPRAMAKQHAEAVGGHSLAVTAAGSTDPVNISCGTTLAYLGIIVDVVTSLWNRNLTSAYWERIESCMPLDEALKATARRRNYTVLREAAGLGTSTLSPSDASAMAGNDQASVSIAGHCVNKQSRGSPRADEAAGERIIEDSATAEDGACSPPVSGTNVPDGAPLPSGEDHGACTERAPEPGVRAYLPSPELRNRESASIAAGTPTTPRSTDIAVDSHARDRVKPLAASSLSSVALEILASAQAERQSGDPGSDEVNTKRARITGVASVAGRTRREEARRRAEIYELFPMASEWGGLPLAVLLEHGLLERRGGIDIISTEATASAVLRKTLQELVSVWDTVPMLFAWRFNEATPSPGVAKQPAIVDAHALKKRRIYAEVLAEPPLASRGYTCAPIGGGPVALGVGSEQGASGGDGKDGNDPVSEGFTCLLSNGDELLRLCEHCRVVVDNVVDAPPSLLAAGNVGRDAREWHVKVSWFQELLTHWTAAQEQWVRLAPAFVPEEPSDGAPTHERARFTEVSGAFQGILALLKEDKRLDTLATRQGTEKGGRSLLAKVRKIQCDLETISHTMDSWLSSCASSCPRLLALPRHQMFRLYRDWAGGRVSSGLAAGDVNERASYLFRGVGEVVWEKTVSTSGTTVRTRMAAAGVRSSGAGLETLAFPSSVPAVGRLEDWVRDVDRQIVSAIVRGVDVALTALKAHGPMGSGGLPLLRVGAGEGGGSRSKVDSGFPSGSGARRKVSSARDKGPEASESRPAGRSNPDESRERGATALAICIQSSLLASAAHWTMEVEAALSGSSPLARQNGDDSSPIIDRELERLHVGLLQHVDGLAEELRRSDVDAHHSITRTALVTQAVHHRDVVAGLLNPLTLPSSSPVEVDRGSESGGPLSPQAGSQVGTIQSRGRTELTFPFAWVCHLRHYYVPQSEASKRAEVWTSYHEGAEGGDGEQPPTPPPPPPLMRVALGPWDISYGFEYAGTLERLWLTPLSERCLLHAVRSAKGRFGGLLVAACGQHSTRRLCRAQGLCGESFRSGGDALGLVQAAQDLSAVFGRAYRMLHSSSTTSPQAVSNVIASTLMAGAVCVLAGADKLPKVSLAVLMESMRTVQLCLHAKQEKLVVNGDEVALSPKPHLLPGYDPLLHQWKLLPWNASTGEGGPFLGVFATLASDGSDPVLPLALRESFRPVLVAPPNTPLLFEAMLLTNSFSAARTLAEGIIQGLRTFSEGVASASEEILKCGTPPATEKVSGVTDRASVAALDSRTILHAIALQAVRTASDMRAPETARELRAARRKLGLASLTISERKAKTDDLSRAVEARVLIAGVVKAFLAAEHGHNERRPPESRQTPSGTLAVSSVGSIATATVPTAGQASKTTRATAGSATDHSREASVADRRVAMVSAFEQTEILSKLLRPLVELESAGRKLAQQNAKTRATELAEAGTADRARDAAECRAMLKRALIVNGMSPTKDQIGAATEIWESLWSCRTPAVIVTGAAGVGKSSILYAMPKMAEYVASVNRKLSKSLRKLASARDKHRARVTAPPTMEGNQETGRRRHVRRDSASASTLDPPGAVYEPPANARGAAPFRRVSNRQMPFVQYVGTTAGLRRRTRAAGDDGTVASGASGSSKGTKATNVSDVSNLSGGSSDGGASVFSQRSAATKSTAASSSAGSTRISAAGVGGVPRALIEGSAFVIPAQEIEVVHTGGYSAEDLIGSTDEKGSWLDGYLIRRLRVLAEGARGSAEGMRSTVEGMSTTGGRHRAFGVGMGDVCPSPLGNEVSGFSHGCRSRLLVLDGPVTRLLEGIVAGDIAGGPALTGPQECGHNSRCLLLPDGEGLALDAWAHVALETGDVRHLSPSTLTSVAVVHLRADGRALIKGMLEASNKKLLRRKFSKPGMRGSLNPVILETVQQYIHQENFMQDGCCLVATQDGRRVEPMHPSTCPSPFVSRARNTIRLLHGLLDDLILVDENSIVWESEDSVGAMSAKRAVDGGTRALSGAWTMGATRVRAVGTMMIASAKMRQMAESRESRQARAATAATSPEDAEGYKSYADAIEPSTAGSTEDAEKGTTRAVENTKVDLTPAEAKEIAHRLRVRVFLLCVYACAWGMGGHFSGDVSRSACSDYLRQFAPTDLRKHIREQNLFSSVVDIGRAKFVSIGNDASAYTDALPQGMWTLSPHWVLQASEMSSPLPPSLVIPSSRLCAVATAAYALLGMDRARVLVEGPSGAGKTALLSQLLRAMGRGVLDALATSQVHDDNFVGDGGDITRLPAEKRVAPVKEQTTPHVQHGSSDSLRNSSRSCPDNNEASFVDVRVAGAGASAQPEVNGHIHVLKDARRRMVDASTAAAVARAEAEAADERGSATRSSISSGPATLASGNVATDTPDAERSTIRGKFRRSLLPSSVYFSMRRQASKKDFAAAIGRALRREKDGVLEGPSGSRVVIFLDDVHATEEACRGEESWKSPFEDTHCVVETVRGMIDVYTPLGEVRASDSTTTDATTSGYGVGADERHPFAAGGLTRACQVHPDLIPRARTGSGGDLHASPAHACILAARTVMPASRYSSAPPGMIRDANGSTLLTSGFPSPANDEYTDMRDAYHSVSSGASSAERLWTRFTALRLDPPSAAELRSVFAQACSDAFGGVGPVSSAMGRHQAETSLLSSEAWRTVDSLGTATIEIFERFKRALGETPTSFDRGNGRTMVGVPAHDGANSSAEAGAARGVPNIGSLDYCTLGRLLRPLVLARTGGAQAPSDVLRLWCHEMIREIADPLPNSGHRSVLACELARFVRQRATDFGVEAEEALHVERSLLGGGHQSMLWTNTRGLVMTVAYAEQQATKAIRSKSRPSETRSHQDMSGTIGVRADSHAPSDGGVSYREVRSSEDEILSGRAGKARVMVAHGVLLNTKDIFVGRALSTHFARAVDLLRVPWPARPGAHPLVTLQDVANVCKCLRQISLPMHRVAILRSDARGMSRQRGPESAFRLACALERAGLVVTDTGAGRTCAKVDTLSATSTSAEACIPSFKAALREAVLTCLGKGYHGPYVREGDTGKHLVLEPGQDGTSFEHKRPLGAISASRVGRDDCHKREESGAPLRPLSPTRTALLIQGAADLWTAKSGKWALSAVLDLVEVGDVRLLFSEAELLTLGAEEEKREQHARTRQTGDGVSGGARPSHVRDSASGCNTDRVNTVGDHTDSWDGRESGASSQTSRWSCWTRGGVDFIHRRIVSCVRKSLMVVLCLTDAEVDFLSTSFPRLTNYSSVRLEPPSTSAMYTEAAHSLSHDTSHSAALTTAKPSPQPGQAAEAVDQEARGGTHFWAGTTHVHLVGMLAFDRFQSTVPAARDVAPEGLGAGAFERDAQEARDHASRLYEACMTSALPASVQVFRAVRACLDVCCVASREERWAAVEAQCLRAVVEEGRSPGGTSLEEVLLLFKYICRLACRRLADRAQTLKRVLGAAEDWGIRRSRLAVEKVRLKERKRDVVKAFAENNEQVERLQAEKTRVQHFWNEQSNKTREQRENQGRRAQEVDAALQPLKAAYEASKESLTTIAEDEMEFLCTLCLGAAAVPGASAESSAHITAATQQRKQRGLHPDLPFVVESVAVMLGNMSDYPQCTGEWVRLKASPSAKIIRSLLLDPAVSDRLNSVDYESQAIRNVTSVILQKMSQLHAEKTTGNGKGEGVAQSQHGSPTDDPGTLGRASPAVAYARALPVMLLKLESRACGLLATWVRDTVILVDGTRRAEEIRAEIHADGKATRQEEERMNAGNANEVAPLDKELALRATYKSRFLMRQRHIHHRQSLVKELGIMRGAVEDFMTMCRQELNDLTVAAELVTGDSLCFAFVACLAAHLPHVLRGLVLERARVAAQTHGLRVSRRDKTPASAQSSKDVEALEEKPLAPGALFAGIERHGLGHFASGVLTNVTQLRGWARLSSSVGEEDLDDGGDEADSTAGSREPCGQRDTALPFHPAFMDAATLTLTTPRWPLILDPDGIALRWIRRVYPQQPLLDTLMPAAMVTIDIIASCASKGQVLPICSTEGGIHPDLAIFLGSDICSHPGDPSDGVATLVLGSCSKSVRLRPGFRIILFTSSLEFAHPRVPRLYDARGQDFDGVPSDGSALLFLADLQHAMTRIQLIRFGGVDCVGLDPDDGENIVVPDQKTEDVDRDGARDDASLPSSSSSSSRQSTGVEDAAVSPIVLAGIGKMHRPGLEATMTLNARLRDDIAAACTSARERFEMDEAAQGADAAQEEALEYSDRLNASHEAVIALLTARPPCFDSVTQREEANAHILRGGEPPNGVKDHVEGDQNRVFNNLIESLFAFQSTLEKGTEAMRRCGRLAQAARAKDAQRSAQPSRSVFACVLRFLTLSNDMLRASGLDAALYCPVFPGVISVVKGAIRSCTTDSASSQEHELDSLLCALSQALASRLPTTCAWIPSLAALATKTREYFPAPGWWETSIVLTADNYDVGRSTSNQITLTQLFTTLSLAPQGRPPCEKEEKRAEEEQADAKSGRAGDDGIITVKDRAPLASGQGLVCAVPDLWCTYQKDAAESAQSGETADSASESESEEANGRSRATLSPHQWDFGFDSSTWAHDSCIAAAFERLVLPPTGRSASNVAHRGPAVRTNIFLKQMGERWTAAKADRAKMTAVQTDAASPFSGDDVLHRLVLLEVTMQDLFALLPRYVLCEGSAWSQWIAEISRCVGSSPDSRCDDDSALDQLRYLLTTPPPIFTTRAAPEGQQLFDSTSSSSSSSSDGDTESDRIEGSAEGDGLSGPSSLGREGRDDTPQATQSLIPSADDNELPERRQARGPLRVRRDSRERMKIKLAHIDAAGASATADKTVSTISAAVKAKISARAASLFGVSSKLSASNVESALVPKHTLWPGAGKEARFPRSTALAASIAPNDEESAGNDEDEYLTFVAESFRPRRDESNWHREKKPLPARVSNTTVKATHGAPKMEEGDAKLCVLTPAFVDSERPLPREKTSECAEATVAETAGDMKTDAKFRSRTGRHKQDKNAEKATPKCQRISASTRPKQSPRLLPRSPNSTEVSTGPVAERRGNLTKHVLMSNTTLGGLTRLQLLRQRRAAYALHVDRDELGSWARGWDRSQLIGLILLFALASDRSLPGRCAAVSLMSQGEDDMDRSALWRQLKQARAQDDAYGRGLQHVLENSPRRIPITLARHSLLHCRLPEKMDPFDQIVAPRRGMLEDHVTRHFSSVLCHIERAAKTCGVPVTIHNAAKPAHMRLSRGVLVSPSRKHQPTQTRTRGARPAEIGAGPARTNMSQVAWEVCLKAAAQGEWVVITDARGVADHVPLLLDGICPQSAIRSAAASTAALENTGRPSREGQVAAASGTGKGLLTVRGGANDIDASKVAIVTSESARGGTVQREGGHLNSVRRRRAADNEPGKVLVSRLRPDNPLHKHVVGHGGVITARSQTAIVAAMRRPLPVPHKNFRVIFLTTSSAEQGRDESLSFAIGQSTVVWWRPIFATPSSTQQYSLREARGQGSRVEACMDNVVQELQDHLGVSTSSLAKANAAVNMISRGLAGFSEAADGIKPALSTGATIDMHLAATLALRQIAPEVVAETPQGHTIAREVFSSQRAAVSGNFRDLEGHGHRPTSPESAGRGSHGARSTLSESCVRIVRDAVHGSVVSTELGEATVIDRVTGLLDDGDMRRRRSKLAAIVSQQMASDVIHIDRIHR